MERKCRRSVTDKVRIFRELFTGLTSVYGTYDPVSGRARQVKAPVTDKVIIDHLMGRQPYGVYLLMKDRIRAIAVDFDTGNRLVPLEFVTAARHYGFKAYIERSKSKGYHIWTFFKGQGVLAFKARLVVCHILEEIEEPTTEIFPKQDILNKNARFGNFINAPLFGDLVPQGKTVFIDQATFQPHPNQWAFLESAERVEEKLLDDIIELNDISLPQTKSIEPPFDFSNETLNRFGLPPCAQRMLQHGVAKFQRVSCFRLAVHLKRLGLPFDVALAALNTWSHKNRPGNGNRVITEREIIEQAKSAFNKGYRGFGCNSEAVIPFCHQSCHLNK